MDTKERLVYWITERERIRRKREMGLRKPWSDDPVFQSTYFCNVRREDDKTTRYIRRHFKPWSTHPMLLYNTVLARFLNWPDSIDDVGFIEHHDPIYLMNVLEGRARAGFQVWSGAYIITTHGLPMGKVQYLVDNVLGATSKAVGANIFTPPVGQQPPTLAWLHGQLMRLEGLGSFLAAQVVADLKNTPGHWAFEAEDKETFVAPGPGSLRGVSWFHYGLSGKVTPKNFQEHFDAIRSYVDANLDPGVGEFCNQDLQNCLCEYDKFMRVSRGVGKSKRNYNGYANSEKRA